MARAIALLIMGLIAGQAFALEQVRMDGEFITIQGETGDISFNSSRDSENSGYYTTGDTLCFNGMLFLNGICLKKEIVTKNNRPKASLRVTNSPKNVEAKMICGANSNVSLRSELDYYDLRGCKLSYQAPVLLNTFWGTVMINGNVAAEFISESLAIRFNGDFGKCKSNDKVKCQEAFLFGNTDLADVTRDMQIVGIFKTVRNR